MKTHKIISVKIVSGSTLNPRWRSDMQVVVTDKGKFIDNMPGVTFGHHNSGFDWGDCIDKTISNIKVIHNSGFEWLNRPPLNFSEINALIKEEAHKTAVETATEIIKNTVTSTETKRKRILVLGATAIKPRDIKGIAKSVGIIPDRITIKNEYEKNIIDINILVNCASYDWLLVGPTAHSLLGLGDYKSLLSRLTEEKKVIIPHIILSDYGGSLKITKENILKEFQKIAQKESTQK